MADVEKLLAQLERKNLFTEYNHMELETLEPDRAVFRLTIRPESCNPYGIAHGGALYTMADSATGLAVHTDGRAHVTQSGSLHFLGNRGVGTTIRATGVVRHRGRTTTLATVDITDEEGTLLATGEYSYFCIRQEPIVPPEE